MENHVSYDAMYLAPLGRRIDRRTELDTLATACLLYWLAFSSLVAYFTSYHESSAIGTTGINLVIQD